MLPRRQDLPKPYPNPYNEGEYFSPSDVQRGQELISSNIPLGLGSVPISPMAQPTRMPTMIPSPMSQPTPEAQDDDSGRFLASLIAQGAAGFGTGMTGGSPKDIMNSANMFQYMRDTQENQRRAKLLTDPSSEESKRRREVYKSLGFQVPNNLSATDLNDPTVLQTLKGQMEQSRLATMPRQGGGVGGAGKTKEEKESKDQKETDEFTSNNETIRKQLEEYRKAIKAIKSPIGYAAEKAKAEGLANSLLLKIKTAEKTGSLDTGSIEIIQKLTGSPDYTRDDVIDSTINQALSNLNDNVENITRGKGTINKFYKPYTPPEITDDREKAIIQNYYNNPNDPDNLQMYQDLRAKKGF
jgi:hypothetical protein